MVKFLTIPKMERSGEKAGWKMGRFCFFPAHPFFGGFGSSSPLTNPHLSWKNSISCPMTSLIPFLRGLNRMARDLSLVFEISEFFKIRRT